MRESPGCRSPRRRACARVSTRAGRRVTTRSSRSGRRSAPRRGTQATAHAFGDLGWRGGGGRTARVPGRPPAARGWARGWAAGHVSSGQYGGRDEACPVSTGGGRVRLTALAARSETGGAGLQGGGKAVRERRGGAARDGAAGRGQGVLGGGRGRASEPPRVSNRLLRTCLRAIPRHAPETPHACLVHAVSVFTHCNI